MRKRGPEGGVLTFVARVETAAGGSDSVLRGDEYTEVECFPSKVKLSILIAPTVSLGTQQIIAARPARATAQAAGRRYGRRPALTVR